MVHFDRNPWGLLDTPTEDQSRSRSSAAQSTRRPHGRRRARAPVHPAPHAPFTNSRYATSACGGSNSGRRRSGQQDRGSSTGTVSSLSSPPPPCSAWKTHAVSCAVVHPFDGKAAQRTCRAHRRHHRAGCIAATTGDPRVAEMATGGFAPRRRTSAGTRRGGEEGGGELLEGIKATGVTHAQNEREGKGVWGREDDEDWSVPESLRTTAG